MPRAHVPAALIALSLAGCDACGKQQSAPSPAPSAVPATSAKKELAGRDEHMSLLAWTDSRVAVSSTVDNPHDFPEHLIDGKTDTAWNGKTGDLAGGFIAFRIPEQARVRTIRITCGYDRIAKDGTDLFTANHRIASVKIVRKGVPFISREFKLDTTRRGAQTIALDTPGGDFTITVTETVPGTKKEWRELVVSEFDVLGSPGAARLAKPHTPRIRIGSLDAPERDPSIPDRPSAKSWASLESYCAAWKKSAEPMMKEMNKPDSSYPCTGFLAECTVQDPITAGGAILEARVVNTADNKERVALAMKTANGWFTDAIVLSDGDRCLLGDVGYFDSKVVSITKKDDELNVLVENQSGGPNYLTDEDGNHSIQVGKNAERVVHVCRLVDGEPKCDKPKRVSHWEGVDVDPPDVSKWTQD